MAVEAGGKATTPNPSSLPRGQRERRQRIIDSASALLVREDFERIQIRDVAERSGVALGTVYRYFNSKEQLYAVVLLDWSATDPIKRRPAPDLAASPAERIRARLHHSIDRLVEYPNFLRLQTVLRQSTDPLVLATFAEFSDEALHSYLGELRDLDPADAADIVSVVTAVLSHETALVSMGRREPAEAHRLCDRMVDIVFSSPLLA